MRCIDRRSDPIMELVVLGKMDQFLATLINWQTMHPSNAATTTKEFNISALLPSSNKQGIACYSYSDGGPLSNLEMVCWTSVFCLVLTGILLLLCYLYPPNEMELVLDMSSMATHIQSLRSNRNTLQKVTVKAFGHYEENELMPIFKELTQIPDLLTFAVELRLPVNILTYFLKEAQKLQDLSLYFQLTGSEGEIATLAESIQKHPSLKSISIESCSFDLDLDRRLDPLILALAELPTLQALSIFNLQSSCSVFSRLFQSTNLRTLELSTIPALALYHVEMLRTNQTLKTLVVPLHANTQEGWAELIRCNKSLQNLILVLEQFPTQHSRTSVDDIFLPIIMAIACNTTLKGLTLDVNDDASSVTIAPETSTVGSRCILALASSLRKNAFLSAVRIGPCSKAVRDDATILMELVKAVKHNFTLETFEIHAACSRILELPEVDFYLTCNKLGRRQILQNVSNATLLDFAIRHQNDPSTLFHIFSEKPEALLPCR
jgi:hypothetical protein